MLQWMIALIVNFFIAFFYLSTIIREGKYELRKTTLDTLKC